VIKMAVFPIPENDGLISITDFIERHRIEDSSQVHDDASAIHWMTQAWCAYVSDHNNASEEFHETEYSHGLVKTMLKRAYDHVEASIVALVTDSTASAEVLSRAVVEASMNVRYVIRGEPFSRLGTYFWNFIREDAKAIQNWEKELIGLSKVEADAIQPMIDRRWERNRGSKMFVADLFGHCSTDEKWPNIAEKFKAVEESMTYRTVYSRMCAQVHNDAEDLLSDFVVATQNPKRLQQMRQETIAFGRLMVYCGIEVFLRALLDCAKVYRFSKAQDIIDDSLCAIYETKTGLYGAAGCLIETQPSQGNQP